VSLWSPHGPRSPMFRPSKGRETRANSQGLGPTRRPGVRIRVGGENERVTVRVVVEVRVRERHNNLVRVQGSGFSVQRSGFRDRQPYQRVGPHRRRLVAATTALAATAARASLTDAAAVPGVGDRRPRSELVPQSPQRHVGLQKVLEHVRHHDRVVPAWAGTSEGGGGGADAGGERRTPYTTPTPTQADTPSHPGRVW
jgi:hypothetical protein